MLWISVISGSPGSSPASASTGIRRSPNESSCSRESQTSVTRRLPSLPKQTWYSSPSGGKPADSSSLRIVSSYWAAVRLGGENRIRTLMGSSFFRLNPTLAPDRLLVEREADPRADGGDDPEADHDLRLRPRHHLEVMVERRHQQDAAAEGFEGEDLGGDRERLDHE